VAKIGWGGSSLNWHLACYSVGNTTVLFPTSNPQSVLVSCSCNHIDVPRATLRRNREEVSEECTVQLRLRQQEIFRLVTAFV
jgi:hypothetical protein